MIVVRCSSPGTILALIELANDAPMLAAATTKMIRKIIIAIESAKGELASRSPRLSGRMLSTLISVCGGTWGGSGSNRFLTIRYSSRIWA